MEDAQVRDIEEYGREVNYGWSHSFNYLTHYYTAEPVEYIDTESGLQVNQIDTSDEVPIYRHIEERGLIIQDRRLTGEPPLAMTDVVGYFEMSERQEQLSSVLRQVTLVKKFSQLIFSCLSRSRVAVRLLWIVILFGC